MDRFAGQPDATIDRVYYGTGRGKATSAIAAR